MIAAVATTFLLVGVLDGVTHNVSVYATKEECVAVASELYNEAQTYLEDNGADITSTSTINQHYRIEYSLWDMPGHVKARCVPVEANTPSRSIIDRIKGK